MAQRLTVVISEKLIEFLSYSPNIKGKLDLQKEAIQQLTQYSGFFFEERHAENYAKTLSTEVSGIDVHVLNPAYGFYTPISTTTNRKLWTPEGEYIVSPK